MRSTLLILFCFASFFAAAQMDTSRPNPNSEVYKFSLMSDAVGRSMDLGKHVSISEPLVGGDFVEDTITNTTVLDGGICIDKGNGHMLRRDVSNADAIHFSWFKVKPIYGTDTTDNYPILSYLFSAAFPYHTFVWDISGNYWCSQTLLPAKAITVRGKDAYEMLSTTLLTTPQGVNAFIFTNTLSSGSLLSGFTVQSTLPESGRILEYNRTDGTVLYLAPLKILTPGKTFEFKDAYYPEKVIGTAVFSNTGSANITYGITYTLPAGTFQIGDTITGATSGAKSVVRFVSRIYNALAVGAVSGTYVLNESITGSLSGATAKFVSKPTGNNGFRYLKVATVSSVSGALDNASDATLTVDSSAFNITGNLDSIGSTGKRQNIFVEAGKSSIGILFNRRGTLEDMTISGFGGDGVLVSSVGGSFGNTVILQGNANLCRFTRVRSNANGGNGIRVLGADANVVAIDKCTVVNNVGFGVCDLSFLGVTVSGTHASANMVGGFTSGNYVNRRTVWDNVYSEGGYNQDPWQNTQNYVGGNSGFIGGTHGQSNGAPYWRKDGYNGFRYEGDNMQNKFLYTDLLSDIRSPKLIFKGDGTSLYTIALEGQTNAAIGRGPAYGFRLAFGQTGLQGIDPKSGMIDIGAIQVAPTSSSTYGFDFKLRRNTPPILTATGGSGTGAILQVDVLNGKATKVNVLTGGKKYPKNATAVTGLNFPNTTFNPIIEDSIITSVQIAGDSLTTNPDNDIISLWKLQSDSSFYPSTAHTGSLGNSTHAVRKLYVDTIIYTNPIATASPILNQSTATPTLQAANFYVGSTFRSIIGNHSTVTATPITSINNSGLNIINRIADDYWSAFNIYTSGATSGMHFSSPINGSGIIGFGAYYNQLNSGVQGGFKPLETNISAFASTGAKFYFMNYKGATIGTNVKQNIIGLMDENGVSFDSLPTVTARLNLRSNSTAFPAIQFNLSGAALKTTASRGAMEAVQNALYFTDSNALRHRIALTNTGVTAVDGMFLVWNSATNDYTPSNLLNAAKVTVSTATISTPMEMIALHVNGNYAPGRGPLINFFAPRGTGVDSMAASIGGVWDNAGLGIFTISTGTGAASTAERLRVTSNGQLAVGTTTPNASALLDISSTTKGALLPRMTTAQANSISAPAGGLLLYNTDKGAFWARDSAKAKFYSLAKLDTGNIKSMQIPIGDALTDRMNKTVLSAGANMTFTFNAAKDTITIASTGGGSGGGITTESDPVFSGAPAAGISSANISNWNTAFNGTITGGTYSAGNLTLTKQNGTSFIISGFPTSNGTIGSESDPVYNANGLTLNTAQTLTGIKTFPASSGSSPSLILNNSNNNYTGTTNGAFWMFNNHLFINLGGVATQLDNQQGSGGGSGTGNGSADTICNAIYNDTSLQVGANFTISGFGRVGSLGFNTTPPLTPTGNNDDILTIDKTNGNVRRRSGQLSFTLPVSGNTSLNDVPDAKLVVLVSGTSSAIITLPAASSNAEKDIVIKNLSSSSITISGGWANDPNAIPPFGSLTFHSNISTWFVIAKE